MEVPDLLRTRLDAEPRNGVALDGEDVAVVTRDRTFVYREEGLLSDATVEVYSNDIERLSVSQGRRKTTFHLAYLDETRQFAVANGYAEATLEALFGGILAAADVLDSGEELRGVYLFSDLTVVVADARLVKHIGASVWETDAEVHPFNAVTGLEFEDGAVATQVVLWVEGRAERIKAPNEEAPLLRRTLTQALCEFYSVDSLDQLNDTLGTDTDDSDTESSLDLEEDITPLIDSDDRDDSGTDTVSAVTNEDWLEPDANDSRLDTGRADDSTGFHTARQAGDRSLGRPTGADDESSRRPTGPDEEPSRRPTETSEESSRRSTGTDEESSRRQTGTDEEASRRPTETSEESSRRQTGTDDTDAPVDDSSTTDVEALERQVRELRRAVDRQNKLLEQQTEHIADLVERIDPD
jgi:hypothetical protein